MKVFRSLRSLEYYRNETYRKHTMCFLSFRFRQNFKREARFTSIIHSSLFISNFAPKNISKSH